jgi:hypothetical protein
LNNSVATKLWKITSQNIAFPLWKILNEPFQETSSSSLSLKEIILYENLIKNTYAMRFSLIWAGNLFKSEAYCHTHHVMCVWVWDCMRETLWVKWQKDKNCILHIHAFELSTCFSEHTHLCQWVFLTPDYMCDKAEMAD